MILTKQKSANAGPSNGTGEGVAYSKRWYVALVRMHHEKKVAERLNKMGIENFVWQCQRFGTALRRFCRYGALCAAAKVRRENRRTAAKRLHK